MSQCPAVTKAVRELRELIASIEAERDASGYYSATATQARWAARMAKMAAYHN